jgi:hypothetical protein
MKDETKAAFANVMAQHDARVTQAKQLAEAIQTERQVFETNYRVQRDNVIIPALKELANEILQPRGWRCEIQPVEKEIAVTFEVYKGDMKALGGKRRPHIRFSSDTFASKVNVFYAAQTQAGPIGTFAPPAITADFVHQEVLKLLERLI